MFWYKIYVFFVCDTNVFNVFTTCLKLQYGPTCFLIALCIFALLNPVR